jgi:Ca2+-binding EF-hand superfamily protein
LKKFIQLENDMERSKQDLALRFDFNLFEAFKLIDQANHSEVYRFELSDTLKRHGVYADRAEVELFYRKYDRNHDGKLRFSEFADSVTPMDRYCVDALNRRTSGPIGYTSQDMFTNLLRKIFGSFREANDMNKRLRERPAFFISAAFERLDENHNGFVSKEELSRFFDAHRHFATSKELELLVARFDKNRDGRITYSEFFDGLSSI